MAQKDRDVLKQYFLTGATPTQAQFADLIDSAINLAADGLKIDASKRLGIGPADPRARLSVQGAFDLPLSGMIAVAPATNTETGGNATGTGTKFSSELAVGELLQIGASVLTVTAIQSDTQMTVHPAPVVAVPASKGFVRGELLAVQDTAGIPQVVVDRAGNVGIGTGRPAAKLQVAGTVVATALQGDGAAIGNLRADRIASGTIDAARIPPLDASKITGPLRTDQIPPIPASKLTGPQPIDPALIPAIPTSKITGLIPMLNDIVARIQTIEQKLGYTLVLSWDFENVTSQGRVSTSVAQSSVAWATGVASQTGAGPAEKFDVGMVLLTREFGTDYPFIDITTTLPITLESLSFRHFHNHNRGYPSFPSYQVRTQIDTGGGGFTDIGAAPLTADSANNANTFEVALGRNLPQGKFRVRWIPTNLNPATAKDTSTEYFALKDVMLKVRLWFPAAATT